MDIILPPLNVWVFFIRKMGEKQWRPVIISLNNPRRLLPVLARVHPVRRVAGVAFHRAWFGAEFAPPSVHIGSARLKGCFTLLAFYRCHVGHGADLPIVCVRFRSCQGRSIRRRLYAIHARGGMDQHDASALPEGIFPHRICSRISSLGTASDWSLRFIGFKCAFDARFKVELTLTFFIFRHFIVVYFVVKPRAFSEPEQTVSIFVPRQLLDRHGYWLGPYSVGGETVTPSSLIASSKSRSPKTASEMWPPSFSMPSVRQSADWYLPAEVAASDASRYRPLAFR